MAWLPPLQLEERQNYCGEEGYEIEEIENWHIGGLKPSRNKNQVLLGKLPLGDGRWIGVK